MEAIKDFFSSLMLRELFKGLALTGRYMFARKITIACEAIVQHRCVQTSTAGEDRIGHRQRVARIIRCQPTQRDSH